MDEDTGADQGALVASAPLLKTLGAHVGHCVHVWFFEDCNTGLDDIIISLSYLCTYTFFYVYDDIEC